MTATRNGKASPTPRTLGWLYVIAGSVGLVAAFVLMLEKIALLKDPTYVPTCSINPLLACGSVMESWQATAFGFPNPLIGIAAFPVVITTGVVLLVGSLLPRWYWLGMQVGTTFGVVFIHFLIFASLYDIAALCPYCMVVWAIMIPIFWYTTLHNVTEGHLPVLRRTSAYAVAGYHSTILALWYLAIVVLIVQAFWDYWTS